MNPALLGTIGGLGASGILGQISHTLGAPRRWLMNALGMPESGAELLAQTFGLDASNPLVRALGIGAEVAFDPLTYVGMPLGSVVGKLAPRAAEAVTGNAARAALQREIMENILSRRAAERAIVERELASKAIGARQAERFNQMRTFVDPESLATGATRSYRAADPAFASTMEQMGLGRINPASGRFELQAGLHNKGIPTIRPDRAGDPGIPPYFASVREGRGGGIGPKPGASLPPTEVLPTAEELELIRLQAQAAGPRSIRSIHSQADPIAEAAAIRAEQLAPPLPAFGGVPAEKVYRQSQSALLEALAKLDALNARTTLSPLEKLAILGSGAGSMLGGLKAFSHEDARTF